MSFQDATRQNWVEIPSKSFNLGDTTQFDLPRVGLLSRLLLMVKGTMTLTDASSDSSISLKDKFDGKPFGMIRELRIKLNSGLVVVRISGYHLYLRNLLLQRSQFPDVGGISLDAGYANSRPYAYAAAQSSGGSANTWRFGLEVPIALNEKDPIGLILLQTQETTITVEIEWETSSNLFTTGAGDEVAWSGSVYPLLETFSVPADKADRPKLDVVHALLQHDSPITATGDKVYEFERGNIYLRVINRVILNAGRAGPTDVDRLEIVYNGTQWPYKVDADIAAWVARERYGRDLPQAVFVWDWAYQGVPNYASARDWIHSGALTEFEQIVRINSGATLGSNNNTLEVTREVLIPVG